MWFLLTWLRTVFEVNFKLSSLLPKQFSPTGLSGWFYHTFIFKTFLEYVYNNVLLQTYGDDLYVVFSCATKIDLLIITFTENFTPFFGSSSLWLYKLMRKKKTKSQCTIYIKCLIYREAGRNFWIKFIAPNNVSRIEEKNKHLVYKTYWSFSSLKISKIPKNVGLFLLL